MVFRQPPQPHFPRGPASSPYPGSGIVAFRHGLENKIFSLLALGRLFRVFRWPGTDGKWQPLKQIRCVHLLFLGKPQPLTCSNPTEQERMYTHGMSRDAAVSTVQTSGVCRPLILQQCPVNASHRARRQAVTGWAAMERAGAAHAVPVRRQQSSDARVAGARRRKAGRRGRSIA